MVSRDQSGYTLIEIILVMAISSALMVGVLAGQRVLRSRTLFDAAVNRVVASATDARNKANSAVNLSGNGVGVANCGAASPTASGVFPYKEYIFAGTEWVASLSGPHYIQLRYWKALPGTAACVFKTDNIDLTSGVAITSPLPNGGRFLSIRDDSGQMHYCFVADTISDVSGSFQNGTCPNGMTSQDFTVADGDGHGATVQIDSSGLARRN